MTQFDESIKKFNKLYGLSCLESPGLPGNKAAVVDRLRKFQDILKEEVCEVEDIVFKLENSDYATPLEALVDIADWLGDIQVYCASEMRKYGLDNSVILETIMASNMSKLDIDGNPIYDERGKVLKGDKYWKPEDLIRTYIQGCIRQAARANNV